MLVAVLKDTFTNVYGSINYKKNWQFSAHHKEARSGNTINYYKLSFSGLSQSKFFWDMSFNYEL